MAVYTVITRAALEALLSQYGLGRLEHFAGIPAGIVNTNYRLETSSGRFALTLFERLSPAQLQYFLSLIAHLRGHGVACAGPIRDRAGMVLQTLGGRPAVIFEWIDGACLAQPAAAACAQVGELLAALHQAAAGFPLSRTGDYSLSWMEQTCADLQPRLGPGLGTVVADALVRVRPLARARLPRGTIHGDLFRDNVLFRDGRLAGVIDFYYACTDLLLLDLAIAVNDWCVDDTGEIDEERARALLAAYHRGRPLIAAEREAWPQVLQAAALQFLLSRLHDMHHPCPGVLLTPKSPLEFERILAARMRAGAAVRAVWPEPSG